MLALPNKIRDRRFLGYGLHAPRCPSYVGARSKSIPKHIAIIEAFEPDDRQKPRDARKSRHPARPAPVAR